MSTGLSAYVFVLVAANVIGALALLLYTSRKRPGEAETTGHIWDGDLTELNNPMPRWWIVLFVGTVVFSVLYLLLYPGAGAFGGLLGWSQQSQYESEIAAQQAREAEIFGAFAGKDVAALATDPMALGTGGRLFANRCSTCHGADGRGAPGFPNLTDADWLYGSDDDTIVTSISNGRSGVMPPYAAIASEDGVAELTAYVQTLSGAKGTGDPTLAARGKERFAALCVACHGADGTGNAMLGAPNLTDAVWLYGGSGDAIASSIGNGRNGIMPPHLDSLGEQRVKLVAAWVRSLAAAPR